MSSIFGPSITTEGRYDNISISENQSPDSSPVQIRYTKFRELFNIPNKVSEVSSEENISLQQEATRIIIIKSILFNYYYSCRFLL